MELVRDFSTQNPYIINNENISTFDGYEVGSSICRNRLDIIQNIFIPGIFETLNDLKLMGKLCHKIQIGSKSESKSLEMIEYIDKSDVSNLLTEFLKDLVVYRYSEPKDELLLKKYFIISTGKICTNLEFIW